MGSQYKELNIRTLHDIYNLKIQDLCCIFHVVTWGPAYKRLHMMTSVTKKDSNYFNVTF